MTIKQGKMTTKTILSIVGIIGALFSAGSIQRHNTTTGNYGDDPNNQTMQIIS